MGLNRAMCTLDSLIIWCYFKLIFFSDVGYLLRRRGWALYVRRKGTLWWCPLHFPLVLSNSTPGVNFKHCFHSDLPCACNDQALLWVLRILSGTAPGPSPQGAGNILPHLANKILRLLLLGRQFIDYYCWYTFLWGLRFHPQEFVKENMAHLNHIPYSPQEVYERKCSCHEQRDIINDILVNLIGECSRQLRK